jgi:2'-5' RNA ligase
LRLFTAVTPPAEAIEDLDAFLEPRREAAEFRWAGIEGWHLTLAFMGDADPWRLEALEERLTRAAHRRAAFAATIAGGGAFPNVGRAKVLWAGVETDRVEIDRLATGARAAATKAGIEVDGGRFKPHLTLARMGHHPRELTSWVRLLDAYRGPTWTVDRIALIESHLGEGPRNRPRYEVLGEYELTRPV